MELPYIKIQRNLFFSKAVVSQNCSGVQVKADGLPYYFRSQTNCVPLEGIKKADLCKNENPLEQIQERPVLGVYIKSNIRMKEKKLYSSWATCPPNLSRHIDHKTKQWLSPDPHLSCFSASLWGIRGPHCGESGGQMSTGAGSSLAFGSLVKGNHIES